MLHEQFIRRRAVAVDTPYIRRAQDERDIYRHGVSDAAVAGAGDIAGIENIPQRDAVCEQHGLLFLYALRHGAAEHTRQKRPEAVLRMAVKEIDLPGLDRGEAAKDEYF